MYMEHRICYVKIMVLSIYSGYIWNAKKKFLQRPDYTQFDSFETDSMGLQDPLPSSVNVYAEHKFSKDKYIPGCNETVNATKVFWGRS